MRLVLLVLFTGVVGFAATITNPCFGTTNSSCSPDPTVVGNYLFFDVQSISVTASGNTVTATLDFDYDDGGATINNASGQQNLAPFSYGGVQLETGDLFFYDPSLPSFGTYQSCENNAAGNSNQGNCVTVPTSSSLGAGLVLDGSTNLTTGGLYDIGGTVSVESAAG